MSFPMRAVDRLFQRLHATYGAQWTRLWENTPINDVKSAWAHELSDYGHRLESVAWALENLPPRAPNVIEFKQLCRQAPRPQEPVLQAPEGKADPERLKAEILKLGELRRTGGTTYDNKAWARRIVARHEAGDKVTPTTLRFAREALRIHHINNENHGEEA